jgi:hypothetical protein
MTSSEALQSLKVHPDLLSADQYNFLDENGYLALEGILTEDEVAYLRNRLDELAAMEGDDAGSELHKEEGTVRLANLLDKDPLFEKFITTPRVLAAITHVIGTDIQLSSLSSRANRTHAIRRGVLSYFVRRGAAYIQNDHKQLLNAETKARLSKEALTLAAAL